MWICGTEMYVQYTLADKTYGQSDNKTVASMLFTFHIFNVLTIKVNFEAPKLAFTSNTSQ